MPNGGTNRVPGSTEPYMEAEVLPGCEDLPKKRPVLYDTFHDAAADIIGRKAKVRWKFTIEYVIDPKKVEGLDDDQGMEYLRDFGEITVINVEEI